jgi:hypothetical protein
VLGSTAIKLLEDLIGDVIGFLFIDISSRRDSKLWLECEFAGELGDGTVAGFALKVLEKMDSICRLR